jgi:hypothetical protein
MQIYLLNCIIYIYVHVLPRQLTTGNPRYTRSHFTRFRYNAIYEKKNSEKILH